MTQETKVKATFPSIEWFNALLVLKIDRVEGMAEVSLAVLPNVLDHLLPASIGHLQPEIGVFGLGLGDLLGLQHLERLERDKEILLGVRHFDADDGVTGADMLVRVVVIDDVSQGVEPFDGGEGGLYFRLLGHHELLLLQV